MSRMRDQYKIRMGDGGANLPLLNRDRSRNQVACPTCRHAAELLRLARSCFDLEVAYKLRHIAQVMQRRASEDGDIPSGYMHPENGHSGDMDRG